MNVQTAARLVHCQRRLRQAWVLIALLHLAYVALLRCHPGGWKMRAWRLTQWRELQM